MSLYGSKLWCFFIFVHLGSCLPDGDLCKWMNGRKYYIDVGESGIISVENATSLTKGVEAGVVQPQIPQRCSVELITCPSCHLEIAIQRLTIDTCSNDKTCRCDFLWIKESAYSKSGREYCGFRENGSLDLVYESKTKLVSVDFLYSGTYKEAFSLQFSAKKNVYIYNGIYDYYQINSSGMIQSPNFPGGYPSDYSAEFIIQNLDASGFIQLIFTDFQLSLWSYVEIFDSNGTRIDVYNGNTFRPPALTSSGPTLTIKFQANDEYPSTGFQARYTFVSYPEKYWINRPSTDCGGFVEDFGGAITMMNMVPSNSLRAYDCIWLIRPRNSHVPDTQVSIRVAQFEEMGPKSTLTIRQGQHSDAPLVESVNTYQHVKMNRGQEYVVPATSGFYIRLTGYFTNKSHLAIIYTTFRYEGCYAPSDFECENGRCVKNALRCDGFNHCGDGSDEASCYGLNPGTAIPEDANWWRTLTPNYYFPKTESGSGSGTNTLILVTSLAGLGMFVLTTIMILVKLHRQRHDDSISREILHTISGDLDLENSPNHQDRSDLPLYDPPPSYEEVIKLYLPPPPPYSSVPRGRTRPSNHRPGRSSGLDNRGYRNDSDSNVRAPARRNRSRIAPHDSNHPIILKVALPEENLSSTMTHTRSGNSHANTAMSSLLEQETKCSLDDLKLSNHGPSQSNVKGLRHQPMSSLREQDPKKELHLNETKMLNSSLSESNVKGRSNADVTASCDCEGACSCKLISKRKQVTVARSSSDSKPMPVTNSGAPEKAFISKKRSFKDMMQVGHHKASTSAIIPHPASMTITMHPPRSKTDQNDSSISSKDTESVDSRIQGHRRSSSGPSEISISLDNLPEHFHKSDASSVSASPLPQINQVKYLASVLLDGIHQSFRFNSDNNVSKHDEKSTVPLDWTNLLSSRKREVSGDTKLEKTGDSHPLLTNGNEQLPSIVNFSGDSATQSLPEH